MSYPRRHSKVPLPVGTSNTLQISDVPESDQVTIYELNLRFQFLASKYPACMEMIQKTSREVEKLVSTYTTKVDSLEQRVQELEKDCTGLHSEFQNLLGFMSEACGNLIKTAVNDHSALPKENRNREYIGNTNSNNNGACSFNTGNSFNTAQRSNYENSNYAVKAFPAGPATSNKNSLSQPSLISSIDNPLYNVSYLPNEEYEHEEEYSGEESSEGNFSKNQIANDAHGATPKQRNWSPRRLFNKKSHSSQPISPNTKRLLEEHASSNVLRD